MKKEQVSFVGEDVYLEYRNKESLSDYCFACGTEDRIPVGGEHYIIVASVIEDGKTEDFSTIHFCPKHMTELAEQILLHCYRVATDREGGAIKLPLLKNLSKTEKAA